MLVEVWISQLFIYSKYAAVYLLGVVSYQYMSSFLWQIFWKCIFFFDDNFTECAFFLLHHVTGERGHIIQDYLSYNGNFNWASLFEISISFFFHHQYCKIILYYSLIIISDCELLQVL